MYVMVDLHGLTRAARSENRELQNEKFLSIPGLELTTPDSQVLVPYPLRHAVWYTNDNLKLIQVEYRCALYYL